jgi:hypothetical protein
LRTLAANSSLTLTRSACRILASLSDHDPVMRKSLMARRDLTNGVAELFWPSLTRDRQAQLLASGWRISPSEVIEIQREMAFGEAFYTSIGLDGRSPYCDCPTLLRRASRALMEAKMAEAAVLMGRCAGIDTGLALNLAMGRLDRGAVLLARLAGLKEDSLLALLARRLPMDAERLPYAASLRIFETLDLKEACRLAESLENMWQDQSLRYYGLSSAMAA